MDHRYVVIMAGGTGTRLWPLSRDKHPKQFLHLVGDVSLLQSTCENISRVIPTNRIYIMADAAKTALAQQQLPQIPKENFIIEPQARDNGPAIAVATAIIYHRDPAATLAIFWADHSVQKPTQFAQTIESAFVAAQAKQDFIVSIGIKPTYPATEFGYIKLGHEVKTPATDPVFAVDQFVEKPDEATAKQYLTDWRYLWNTGYKVYHAKLMLDLFAQHQPEFNKVLTEITKTIEADGDWHPLFAKLERRDIERLITEKTKDILVIPADLGWSDIGSWKSLHDVLVDQSGNDLVVQTEGDHIGVNNQRCLIIGKKKLIATVGLSDIVIVETDDALLVAHKSAAQDVKQIIEQLKETNKHDLL